MFTYIQCPYCKGSFIVKNFYGDFGMASCSCDEYPIITGILYLKKDDALLNKRVVVLIKNKRFTRALWTILSGTRVQKIILLLTYKFSFVWKIYISRQKVLALLRIISANRAWFSYLLNREDKIELAMAANIVVHNKLKSKLVVDIGCGVGSLYEKIHAISTLEFKYIGIEKNFSSLFMARLYIKDDVCWICSDVEQGLPMHDSVATDVVFLDCFAWIYNKDRSVGEAARVLIKKGTVSIVNIHNETRSSWLWGYGISPIRLRDTMSRYFKSITFFKNDRFNKIISSPMATLLKEGYSCRAIK